jgi:hypothetical protein
LGPRWSNDYDEKMGRLLDRIFRQLAAVDFSTPKT